jgi:CPA2 family monovalent cation:H+ antiporter-2
MDHEPVLISTIAIGLTAAFIGGFLARRIGLPTIVGYILAGVAIGPFTPGLIADVAVATELAELGVILLMFGVGIHFSIRDLLAVRSIAIPGALLQTVVGVALGLWLGSALGRGDRGWSSGLRSPSRAPSCSCGRSRIAARWTRETDESRSVG